MQGPHVDQMLRFGSTRVEIGVQVIDDKIYALTNRGHTVSDVAEAFQIARDAGLKIFCSHDAWSARIQLQERP